jgi:hypothetical protein
MIWQDYRRAKGKAEVGIRMPSKQWLLMVFLSLFPIGALVFHNLTHDPIEEFDAPNKKLVIGWAEEGLSCSMQIDQNFLQRFRQDYKLATACLIYDGTQDILDDPYMQVGGLYDIDENRSIKKLTAGFTPNFAQLYVQKNSVGVFVALLLVPKGIEPSQFSTLRQARALGVRIPNLALTKSL